MLKVNDQNQFRALCVNAPNKLRLLRSLSIANLRDAIIHLKLLMACGRVLSALLLAQSLCAG